MEHINGPGTVCANCKITSGLIEEAVQANVAEARLKKTEGIRNGLGAVAPSATGGSR